MSNAVVLHEEGDNQKRKICKILQALAHFQKSSIKLGVALAFAVLKQSCLL
jgi:hypothetical protein